jgi:hypothetical protein
MLNVPFPSPQRPRILVQVCVGNKSIHNATACVEFGYSSYTDVSVCNAIDILHYMCCKIQDNKISLFWFLDESLRAF